MVELVKPHLRLLDQDVGAPLGLAEDELALGLRGFLELLRQPVCRQQRVAEIVLALAVLREERFHAHQVAAEAIDLPHRVLVVVGGFGQERHDIGAVVAAHRALEALLAHVHGAYPHHPLGRLRGDGVVGVAGRLEHQVLTIRLPKIAVPTRTSVAPSWMATSKSWLMPIDSSRTWERSMPSSNSRSRSSRRRRK